MCLELTSKSKVKIVRFPIIGYKTVKKWAGKWTGPFFYENTYEYNKMQQADVVKGDRYIDGHRVLDYKKLEHLEIESPRFYRDRIYEGFHCFSKMSRVYRPGEHLAIIPKGAEYCRGMDDDIVSTHIIVCSNALKFIQLYIKNIFSKPIKLQ